MTTEDKDLEVKLIVNLEDYAARKKKHKAVQDRKNAVDGIITTHQLDPIVTEDLSRALFSYAKSSSKPNDSIKSKNKTLERIRDLSSTLIGYLERCEQGDNTARLAEQINGKSQRLIDLIATC